MFKNKIGNCSQINNDHTPTIEKIGSDLLLLNHYAGNGIEVENEDITLNGTYVIKYFNVTIKVNDRKFFSIKLSPHFTTKRNQH